MCNLFNLFACFQLFHACNVRGIFFILAQSDSIFISCHGDAPAGGPTMWIGRYSTSNYASSLWIAQFDAPNASKLRKYIFPSTRVYVKWTCLHHTISICQREKPVMQLENDIGNLNPSHLSVCFRSFQDEVWSQPVNPIVCKKQWKKSVESGEAVKVDEESPRVTNLCKLKTSGEKERGIRHLYGVFGFFLLLFFNLSTASKKVERLKTTNE